MVGVGLIVNVIDWVGPVQLTPLPVYNGVKITCAVTGVELAFTAVNGEILPLPVAFKPMDGVLFTHE